MIVPDWFIILVPLGIALGSGFKWEQEVEDCLT
jgi:hypothetical protein